MAIQPTEPIVPVRPGVHEVESQNTGGAAVTYYDGHGGDSDVGKKKGNIGGAPARPVPVPGAGMPDQERKDWK